MTQTMTKPGDVQHSAIAPHLHPTGRAAGIAAVALAIGFNVPFSMLASIYDYPDVLRRPAGQALDMFAAGGPTLVLVWYGFMLCALGLAMLGPLLAITGDRLAARPALAIAAALSGSLAGLAQAIGLSRWVFAVPELARVHADPTSTDLMRAAAERSFEILNAWGGVAIGEHIGQLLTALFVLQMAWLQGAERRMLACGLGLLTAALLLIGAQEGVALALGVSGDVFATTTIVGFLGFTLWLIWTGAVLVRGPARRSAS